MADIFGNNSTVFTNLKTIIEKDGGHKLLSNGISSLNFDGSIPKLSLTKQVADIKAGDTLFLNDPYRSMNQVLITQVEKKTISDVDYFFLYYLSSENVNEPFTYQSTFNHVDNGITYYGYNEEDLFDILSDDIDNVLLGNNGWSITNNGNAVFSNVFVRGRIEATDGIFDGTLTAGVDENGTALVTIGKDIFNENQFFTGKETLDKVSNPALIPDITSGIEANGLYINSHTFLLSYNKTQNLAISNIVAVNGTSTNTTNYFATITYSTASFTPSISVGDVLYLNGMPYESLNGLKTVTAIGAGTFQVAGASDIGSSGTTALAGFAENGGFVDQLSLTSMVSSTTTTTTLKSNLTVNFSVSASSNNFSAGDYVQFSTFTNETLDPKLSNQLYKVTSKGTGYVVIASDRISAATYTVGSNAGTIDLVGSYAKFGVGGSTNYLDYSSETGTLSVTGKIVATSGEISGYLTIGPSPYQIKIGRNVSPTNRDGIYIDSNNYWTFDDNTGTKFLFKATEATLFKPIVHIGDSGIIQTSANVGDGSSSSAGIKLDATAAKFYPANSSTPKTTISNSTGIITATEVDLSGKITASSGIIGGFTIGGSSLYAGSGSNFVGIIPASLPFFAGATANDGTGAKFSVTNAGALTSTSGNIAGWNLSSTQLSSSNVYLNSQYGYIQAGSTAPNTIVMHSTQGLYAGASTFASSPFSVDLAGNLSATSATITGAIKATSGYIGGSTSGWTINSGYIQSSGGTAKITLDAINAKLYVGTGTYGNTNTPFYVDGASQFSLGDKLTFTGGNLTISGAITAISGTFTGAVNASSGNFTGYVTAGTARFGAGVQTGKNGIWLNATNYWYDDGTINATLGNIGGWTLGSTTLTGTNTSLSNTGVITVGTTNDVAVLSSADATYRIWAGNSAPASAPFSVTKAGALVASTATITGTVNANAGNFTSTVTVGNGATTGQLKVGTNATAITILGANTAIGTKIYSGSNSTYNNTGNTGFYIDASGQFSIGSTADTAGLSWSGTALTVKGALTATSGSFTGDVNITSPGRLIAGTLGGNSVVISSLGITGVGASQIPTFYLPTDGSSPIIGSFKVVNTGLITPDAVSGVAISGTSGQTTITVGSNTGLYIGMSASGTGIGTSAIITGISGTTVSLSVANSTIVSGTGTFTPNSNVIVGTLTNNITVRGQTAGSVLPAIYTTISGTSTTDSANNGFYVGQDGKFRFAQGTNVISGSGGSLSVTGTINATGGNFTSTVTIGQSSTLGRLQVGTNATNYFRIDGTDTNTTTAIYTNGASYGVSGVWIDASGRFSLGTGLTWNGSTLSIGGTSASTVVSGAASGASSLQPGTAASDVNNNTTTITGSKIRTGTIESTGYSYTSGNFSTTGTQFDLTNGLIRSKNFLIDSSGNAYFNAGTFSGSITSTADISGGTITGGTFRTSATPTTNGVIFDSAGIRGYNTSVKKFDLTSSGILTASDVILTGTINATSGSFTGAIKVGDTPTSTDIVIGHLRDQYNSNSANLLPIINGNAAGYSPWGLNGLYLNTTFYLLPGYFGFSGPTVSPGLSIYNTRSESTAANFVEKTGALNLSAYNSSGTIFSAALTSDYYNVGGGFYTYQGTTYLYQSATDTWTAGPKLVAGNLPYATSTGYFELPTTSIANNGSIDMTVNFPSSRFSQVPVVTATWATGITTAFSKNIQISIPASLVSTSSCTVRIHNYSGSSFSFATNVYYAVHAIQMKSTAWSYGTMQ